MRSKLLLAVVAGLLNLNAAKAEVVGGPPIQVMVVGVYHMSNPGRDLHHLKADDVLEPGRQGEIAALTGALAKFQPSKIGVEWPADVVAERYPQYLAGALAPSRNEVVQLGFRLAKLAHSEGVFSLDADGDFPYERVKNFAGPRGLSATLDAQNKLVQDQIAALAQILSKDGISATLRYLNDPVRLKTDNDFYRSMLKIGAGDDQPGADLVAAWYRRNLLICANLVQLAKPGDRIVVFFGSGHAFLLRQCVAESPGFALVEPDDYLPMPVR